MVFHQQHVAQNMLLTQINECNIPSHPCVNETEKMGNWTEDPVLRWCMASDPANCSLSDSAALIGEMYHIDSAQRRWEVCQTFQKKEKVEGHSHEGMVDERPSSRSLQHVVETVLQLSEALTGGGRAGAGSGRPRERGPQQPRAVGRGSALRGGRLAPLRLHGGERHEFDAPVVVRSRWNEHSDAAVVGWTCQHSQAA